MSAFRDHPEYAAVGIFAGFGEFDRETTDGETIMDDMTTQTIQRVRNEILEAAARVVLSEQVTPDATPDPTDVSYNMALTHAAEAVLRMRT